MLQLRDSLLSTWRTTNRVTVYFVEQLPADLWRASIPEVPTRTIRGIMAHLHNSRRTWIRTLGREHGIQGPDAVDRRTVSRRGLVSALKRSSQGIEALLLLGLESGGVVPPSKGYVWRNLPLDVGHVLTYFVAHEAHHRGQILMAARQLGRRLPKTLCEGLWQWTTRSREV